MWQTTTVAGVVVLAAAYTARYLWRRWRGKGGTDCAFCPHRDGGCGSRHSSRLAPPPSAPGPR